MPEETGPAGMTGSGEGGAEDGATMNGQRTDGGVNAGETVHDRARTPALRGRERAEDEPVPGCAFCTPSELNEILTETPHFRVVADFAPVVAGHTLIISRQHFACYGAVPLAYEDELVALKRRVARFFRARYLPAVFFEHGIFRQTVFHAHLHAFPLGSINLPVFELAHPDGRPVRRLADVRAWYNERGPYFYVEQARVGDTPLEAAIFPPEEERYFQVLGTLREQANAHGRWAPAPVRRMTGGPVIAALATAWHAWDREAAPEASDAPDTPETA